MAPWLRFFAARWATLDTTLELDDEDGNPRNDQDGVSEWVEGLVERPSFILMLLHSAWSRDWDIIGVKGVSGRAGLFAYGSSLLCQGLVKPTATNRSKKIPELAQFVNCTFGPGMGKEILELKGTKPPTVKDFEDQVPMVTIDAPEMIRIVEIMKDEPKDKEIKAIYVLTGLFSYINDEIQEECVTIDDAKIRWGQKLAILWIVAQGWATKVKPKKSVPEGDDVNRQYMLLVGSLNEVEKLINPEVIDVKELERGKEEPRATTTRTTRRRRKGNVVGGRPITLTSTKRTQLRTRKNLQKQEERRGDTAPRPQATTTAIHPIALKPMTGTPEVRPPFPFG